MKNKLFENILALTTIKGLQYILAFVTFPYLTRVLQVEMFGAIVFVQGIINYFILCTDYGFNLLGPKEIAQNGKSLLRSAARHHGGQPSHHHPFLPGPRPPLLRGHRPGNGPPGLRMSVTRLLLHHRTRRLQAAGHRHRIL